MLGLSRSCIEKALKNREIPNNGKIGGRWAISRRAIEVYLETNCWPVANPAAAEVAEIVVDRLSEIIQAGLEAGVRAMVSAMADVAAGEDRGQVVRLISARKAAGIR